MADDLTKALLVEEAAPPRLIADALFAAVTGNVPLLDALVDAGAVTSTVLDRYLARSDEPQLTKVVPLQELVDRLPPGLCKRLLAVPVRRDAITGTVDIAVADPTDPHPADEIAFHLGVTVRIVRASLAAIQEGLRRARMQSIPPPTSRRPPAMIPDVPPSRPEPAGPPPRTRRDTPTWGTPNTRSDQPTSKLGSEIPIPLTRRAVGDSRGGTQRPGPIADPAAKLGKGISVVPGAFEVVIEKRGPGASHAIGGTRLPTAPPTGFAAPTSTFDIGSALAALRIATNRDEVLELALAGGRTVALKVGLFVVKKGGYQGWSCSPEFGDRAAFSALFVPMDENSIFDRAVQDGTYLGPIPNDDVHRRLVGVLRGASRDVAVTPIRVSGKTAVVIVADGLGDTMIATRRLDEIARAAGDAFGRIVRSKR